jgi:hypothetical protein
MFDWLQSLLNQNANGLPSTPTPLVGMQGGAPAANAASAPGNGIPTDILMKLFSQQGQQQNQNQTPPPPTGMLPAMPVFPGRPNMANMNMASMLPQAAVQQPMLSPARRRILSGY